MGLLHLPGLKRPQDFERLVEQALSRACSLRDRAAQLAPSEPLHTVRALDELSDTLCQVVDPADLLRNAHPQHAWRTAAENAYHSLVHALNTFNADRTVYSSIRSAETSSALSGEALLVAQSLRADLERTGIHLPERQRSDISSRLSRCSSLGSNFQRNVADAEDSPELAVSVPLSRRAASALPAHLRSRSLQRHSDGTLAFLATDDAVNSALRSVNTSALREKILQHSCAEPSANSHVLQQLLSERSNVASQLERPSYAHLCLENNVAAHPDGVEEFLCDLSQTLRPHADDEAAALAEKIGKSKLDIWDKQYAIFQAKKEIMGSQQHDSLSQYFPLSAILAGFDCLCQRLFNAKLEEGKTAGEKGDSFLASAWDPSMKRLELRDNRDGAESSVLGEIWLDLATRPGKSSLPAHYTIRCGRRLPSGEYQSPKVALVASFASAPELDRRGVVEPVLRHSEFATLLHEFGHALHSLLSRTEFQHLAGTRGPLDLVEVPSHVMESYAWNESALSIFSRHISSGEPLPTELVQLLKQRESVGAALDFQQQVLCALVDLRLHRLPNPSQEDVQHCVKDTEMQVSSLKALKAHRWERKFVHLVGYGSSYYTYIFSKCFVGQMLEKFGESKMLSREFGLGLRSEILQHGCAMEGGDALRNFLGSNCLTDRSHAHVPSLPDHIQSVLRLQ
jgi:intermediate peptidase